MVDSTISHYHIVAELGRGGIGGRLRYALKNSVRQGGYARAVHVVEVDSL